MTSIIAKANVKVLIESIVSTFVKNGGTPKEVAEIFKEINDEQPTS